MNEQPIAGVCANPLIGMKAGDMTRVPVGVSLAWLRSNMPELVECNGLLVCRVNGRLVSRLTDEQRAHVAALEEAGGEAESLLREYAVQAANWESVTTEPDAIVEWYEMPQGRFGQAILGAVILIAAAVAQFGFGIAVPPQVWQFGATLLIGGLINALVAPRQQQPNLGDAASGVYSTSLAGNAARLDQPIWKNFGRPKITPPFACAPYVRYLPSNPSLPLVDNDQYYYALFAIGIGNHQIEKAFIGRTPISHFQDVIRAEYLAPGTGPSTVQPNIVTTDEVASLELQPGRYVGGYAACRPGDRVVAVGLDVGADQGLGKIDGSSTAPVTVTWIMQVREIDDYGSPISNWTTIDSQSRKMDTNTPQRWSSEIVLSAPIRCEVRGARTNNKETSSGARDTIQWIGLRARLQRQAPLDPHVAHFEVVMRSGQQLSQQSQRDFSMIVRALTRTWDPVTGWGPEVFTRNPAWALADLWSNPIWGEGLPDERIDLQGLYDWAQTLDARQDHFDYTVADGSSAWELAQLIAHAGRAKAFRRGAAVRSISRDEAVTLPRMAITPRNAQAKSMVLTQALPGIERPDGVVARFTSNVTWDTATIYCPCPGYSVPDPTDPRFVSYLPAMTNPLFIDLPGITGAKHAEREGLYQAANLALRQASAGAKVEMEGMLFAFMDPIRWQPQIPGYGQSGDVAFWDPTTLVMGLSEPPDFSSIPDTLPISMGGEPIGGLFLTLVRDDGSLTTPVVVTPGPTAYDVRLPVAPDFPLVLDDAGRERPKFLLGPALNYDEVAKVVSVSDGGKSSDGAQLFDIKLLVDDIRVHQADNALLPRPDQIQDPIDDGVTRIDGPDAPPGLPTGILYATVVNISARTNKQFAHGIKIDGINPDWTLSLALINSSYSAWSEFARDDDHYAPSDHLHSWSNQFRVTTDLGVGGLTFGAKNVAATADLARAAFSGGTLFGSTSYTFWIDSDAIDDNRGGLSIAVARTS